MFLWSHWPKNCKNPMASAEINNYKSGFCWPLFFKVTLGHLALLLALFLLFHIQSCRQKKPQTIKAKLVTLSSTNTPEKITQNIPPKKIPPKAIDSPQIKIKKPKVNQVVKPKSEPTKRNNVDTTLSPKKSTKYRTPEQIRKSKLTPETNNLSPIAPSVRTPAEAIDINNFRKRIAKKIDSKPNTNTYDPEWNEEYYQLLINHIYRLWEQPTKTEVGNPHLTVRIMLEIDKSGKVTAKHITKNSNNSAMDNSVKRLLYQLSQFPPFPKDSNTDSMTKVIVLKLTN